MNILIDFFMNFWHLSSMIGLYVIIGLIFVGIVHLFVSQEWIKKHLGTKSRYGAIKGALYGIPLPLCSCGVIPLATGLRKKGASKASVTSFFITTPMTGVDSIIATYGVFGLPMAILRVVSSFISGVLAGTFVKENSDDLKKQSSCCSSCCDSKIEVDNRSNFKKGLDYALNDVFSDIVKPMFWGLVFAAVFVMIIPQNGVEFLNEQLLFAYLLVFLVSLPMYVCSISAIPMALSMMAVGVSPGVAFVFLAAAPVTNIITAGVIKKVLGNDVLIVYLISIIFTTLTFALLIDFAFPMEWFSIDTFGHSHEEHPLYESVFGGIFLVMMGVYLFKSYKRA